MDRDFWQVKKELEVLTLHYEILITESRGRSSVECIGEGPLGLSKRTKGFECVLQQLVFLFQILMKNKLEFSKV